MRLPSRPFRRVPTAGAIAALAGLLGLQIATAAIVVAQRADRSDGSRAAPVVSPTPLPVLTPVPVRAAPPAPRPRPVTSHPATPHRVVPKPKPVPPKPRPHRDVLVALRGLSTWVDLYDYGKAGPAAAAALADTAAAHGVSTIWVETSRYDTADIAYPAALAALVDRAAARHVRVIAWVLPEFRSVSADLDRAKAAASFRTSARHGFAALGLDIEVSSGAPPSERSGRLLSLARSLHGHVGMPLVAIVPPPVGFSHHPSYWPGFPWRSLAADADAIATMGYWSYSHDAEPGSYTRTVLQQTQQLVGRSSYPIHVIGGLAAETSASGAASFCSAARAGGAIGASLYDLTSTPAALWSPLQACRQVGH